MKVPLTPPVKTMAQKLVAQLDLAIKTAEIERNARAGRLDSSYVEWEARRFALTQAKQWACAALCVRTCQQPQPH